MENLKGSPILARKFGPHLSFRVLLKRILDTLKSFSYFWALSGAPTYAVPGLFHLLNTLHILNKRLDFCSIYSTVISSSNEESEFFAFKYETQKECRKTKLCLSCHQSIRISGVCCYFCKYSFFPSHWQKKLTGIKWKLAKFYISEKYPSLNWATGC